MVDAITILAVALLVGGIAGTLVPLVPGGLLSLSGLLLYWWHTGFTDPGTVAMLALLFLGLCTVFVEFFAGASSARYGGASWTTTVIAVVVAMVLLVVTGPIGLVVGLFGTVFLVEFVRNGDLETSGRAAFYASVGVLASTAVQVLLTTTIFLGFVVVVFVL
ncbi:DUF456 domain-containing protein [Halobacteria archaeon AArc-m2/3/4]|uniref:DUF456 domain-containing protein n=1 Tax=Natronoglomus mannanivorans TaxID=2979990 RepID=A0AAP2YVU1_9EURY|nr:DUF456 domain-containing protein [Halobacteria archaeon AArc-xg1-1]MCU4971602.1 DUF456 domain-containing protein [Halobacteria archaeon AArc-m2/3/4]